MVSDRVLFRAGECPIDNGPMYLLRDTETGRWLFYAPCCGVASERPRVGFGDMDGLSLSPHHLGVNRARIPTRDEIATGPWADLDLVIEASPAAIEHVEWRLDR